VNLDEFASSPEHSLVFINLLDIPNASIVRTSQPPTTIPITFRSTRIKCKQLNMFSPIIDAINKSTKFVMEVMDHIYFMQLEIEECCMKIEEQIIKVQLEYYKHRNKKNPQDKQGYGHNFFSS